MIFPIKFEFGRTLEYCYHPFETLLKIPKVIISSVRYWFYTVFLKNENVVLIIDRCLQFDCQ